MSETPKNPYDQPSGDAPLFSPEEPPKSSRGCLFYGCITAAIIAVLGLILLAVGAYLGVSWLRRTVNDYTSPTPVVLPKVSYTEEQRKDFESRRKAYQEAVAKGEAAELVLSADDINTWIDQEPKLKGLAYITITGDKIGGQLCVPLDNLGLPMGLGKGRYFNGSATITVSLHDGDLEVHAKEFQVNGKAPAGDFMNQFSRENLAKDWSKDPNNAETLRHLERIEVKDGKIYVKARARAGNATSEIDARPDADPDDAKPKTKPDGDADKPKADDLKPEPGDGGTPTKPDEKDPDDAPATKKAA